MSQTKEGIRHFGKRHHECQHACQSLLWKGICWQAGMGRQRSHLKLYKKQPEEWRHKVCLLATVTHVTESRQAARLTMFLSPLSSPGQERRQVCGQVCKSAMSGLVPVSTQLQGQVLHYRVV